MATDLDGFVQYARELQQARDLRQLLDAVQAAVARVTPYRSITLAIVETTSEGLMARIIGAAGPREPRRSNDSGTSSPKALPGSS